MENYLTYGKYTCTLLKNLINETPALEPHFDCNWEYFYEFCKSHKITNTIYPVIKKLDIPSNVKNCFYNDFIKSIKLDIGQSSFLEKLSVEFEKENICFILLKGSLIKHLYPETNLRSNTDIDILIKKVDFEKAKNVLLKYSFQTSNFDMNKKYDVPFFKKSLNIELHTSLTPFNYVHYDYFTQAFNKAHTINNSKCHYEMSNEDFYIYVVYHIYKHFISGGVGIRYLLDIFLINKNMTFNQAYVKAELKKLKLKKFNDTLIELSEMFFGEKKSDKKLDELANYIFVSGAHGKISLYDIAKFNGIGTKDNSYFNNSFNYYSKAWFIGKENMSIKYPILKKYGFLLPFCYIHKGFYTLFFNKKALKREFTDLKNTNDKNTYFEHICNLAGIK